MLMVLLAIEVGMILMVLVLLLFSVVITFMGMVDMLLW